MNVASASNQKVVSDSRSDSRSWLLTSQLVRIRVDAYLTILMLPITLLLCYVWGIKPNFDLRRHTLMLIVASIFASIFTFTFFLTWTSASRRWGRLQGRRVSWFALARNLLMIIPIAWIYSHIKAGVLLGETSDAWLHQLDLFVCGGHNPVFVMRSLVPENAVFIIRLVYKLFKPFFLGAIIWLILDCRRARAYQLTAALVIAYHLGAFAYHLAPSYGPCYFVEGADTTSMCEGSHLIQQLLLKHVRDVQLNPSTAVIQPWLYIGAFPSLHISHTLIVMWFFRKSSVAFMVTGCFTFVSAIATILFGWHYLLDLVAGAVLAAIAVYFSGFRKVKFRIPVLRRA